LKGEMRGGREQRWERREKMRVQEAHCTRVRGEKGEKVEGKWRK
jgi:hypothetical protein